VIHAARQRLRPIIMTSLAFMCGVLPLALASGAGSGAQHAVGTGVIGGMLASTFLAIIYLPVFFVVILGFFKVKPRRADEGVSATVPAGAAGPMGSAGTAGPGAPTEEAQP
jgi:multidrug efflux pump